MMQTIFDFIIEILFRISFWFNEFDRRYSTEQSRENVSCGIVRNRSAKKCFGVILVNLVAILFLVPKFFCRWYMHITELGVRDRNLGSEFLSVCGLTLFECYQLHLGCKNQHS